MRPSLCPKLQVPTNRRLPLRGLLPTHQRVGAEFGRGRLGGAGEKKIIIMGKSLRSKVKRTYKGLKRKVIEPHDDARLEKLAAKQHAIAQFTQQEEDGTAQLSLAQSAVYSHGGFTPKTNYVPNHERPKLNRVHGPLADDDKRAMDAEEEPEQQPPRRSGRKQSSMMSAADDDEDPDVVMKLMASSGMSESKKQKRSSSVRRKKREKIVGVSPDLIRKTSRHPKNKAHRIRW